MSPRDGGPARAAILAAAGDLLESGGPDAVTLRSVGASAGLSRSAPYRHFRDKADLLAALALGTLIGLTTAVRDGAEQGVDGGCRGYVRQALSRPRHYQLIFGDRPIDDPAPDIEAAADAGVAAFTALVERGQRAGELPAGPARELGTILWAAMHGLTQLYLTGHLSEPRTVEGEAGLDVLVDLTLRSLRP